MNSAQGVQAHWFLGSIRTTTHFFYDDDSKVYNDYAAMTMAMTTWLIPSVHPMQSAILGIYFSLWFIYVLFFLIPFCMHV
jgi:hypothetical protein